MDFKAVLILCAVAVFGLIFFCLAPLLPKYRPNRADVQYRHPEFAATIFDRRMWQAVEEFPDLKSCQDKNNPNRQTVDWEKLRLYASAKVCLFYLFETMDAPKAAAYLKGEGFRVADIYHLSVGSVSSQDFGYDLDADATYISASVKQSDRQPIFGGKRFSLLSSGQRIWVVYFPDNKLAAVHALPISRLN